MTQNNSKKLIFWALIPFLLVGLLAVKIFAPDKLWIMGAILVILIADIGFLIKENRKALSSRSASFGASSLMMTVLVIGIIGVINFLAHQNPKKLDLTENKIHSLSDQSRKAIKRLKQPLQATLFATPGARERFRPLLENYSDLNNKFELEYVDPNKAPTRVKKLGIKRENTLHLSLNDKSQVIEELTEEKITNALLNILKKGKQTLCWITGHGEKSVLDEGPDGFFAFRQGLENQSYEVKEVTLATEAKIPADCNAIAIFGATSEFFDSEIKTLSEYLEKGGNALFAIDKDLNGKKGPTKLLTYLKKWHVSHTNKVVVDPISKVFGVDAATPVLPTFARQHPISREFGNQQCFFPIMRSLDIIPKAPAGLQVEWIAQTSPKSWAESTLSEFATGRVKFNEGKDQRGPVNAAIAIKGKIVQSKDTEESRIVVFGTSAFAGNTYARFGINLDMALNSASWVLRDESQISIRGNESEPGKIQLSQTAGLLIFWLTVVIIPLLIAGLGIVIWMRRKKL